MPVLVTLSGPHPGRVFPVRGTRVIVGRQMDCGVWLESPAVSRQHACLTTEGGQYFLEDLRSANGTFVNGHLIDRRTPVTDQDRIEIGPYEFALRQEVYAEEEGPSTAPENEETQTGEPRSRPVIRLSVSAAASNPDLFVHNAQRKLQLLVETAQALGQSADLKTLLGRLLDQLFRLFPQADRGMVIQADGDDLRVVSQKQRQRAVARPHRAPGEIGSDSFSITEGDFGYSRSIVRRTLTEKIGQLCEDIKAEQGYSTQSISLLELRSFVCVPLLGIDGKPLGVLQLDCVTPGKVFHDEDLKLLTAIGLHVASVIQNAILHAQRLREEAERRELELARETQQRILPQNFSELGGGLYELYARVIPARSVSGDLYDFYLTPEGKLSFFLGDVVGKGMSAALFMVAVRTLTRALAGAVKSPSDMLVRLNTALLADNPNEQYVTLAHGTYDPRTATVELVSAGHLPPLLRRRDGRVDVLDMDNSFAIGTFPFDEPPTPLRFPLQPGETLILYSDGITEAHPPDNKRDQFEVERMCQAVAGMPQTVPLVECVEKVRNRIALFTRTDELSDDQTMLLLRRLR